jgi:uncharacterized protein
MTREQRLQSQRAMASPWVINIREMGRHPGGMRSYQRSIPAPPGFGLEVIGIPEGSPIELDLRLESATEGVYVSGSASAEVEGECARCLEPIAYPLTVRMGELFAYPDSATEATTDEDEVSRVVDDLVDTEELVRDAVLLALPLAPLCQEDCPGLCPECGDRWVELGPEHTHETLDPRWAALQGKLTSDADGDTK